MFALGSSVRAAVSFDFVTVGDAGNAADARVMNRGPAADFTTGYGSVGYAYRVATTNVTNQQYVEFLNKVDPTGANALTLWQPGSANVATGLAYSGGIDRNTGAADGSKYFVKAGQDNHPAVWIKWTSTLRFANWLQNGQGTGGTENGVYNMATYDVKSPPTVAREANAQYFLPSENEFYKAAYYDPTKGGTGGYYEYGTRSDIGPTPSAPGPGTNNANQAITSLTNFWQTGPLNINSTYLTDVGAYPNSKSYYGLLDVEGPAYNWTEGMRFQFGSNFPIRRGGTWQNDYTTLAGASYRNIYSFANSQGYNDIGFRIAAAVPEPTSLSALALAMAGLLTRRPRQA